MSEKNIQKIETRTNQGITPKQKLKYEMQGCNVTELMQKVNGIVEDNYMFEVNRNDDMEHLIGSTTVGVDNNENDVDVDDEENNYMREDDVRGNDGERYEDDEREEGGERFEDDEREEGGERGEDTGGDADANNEVHENEDFETEQSYSAFNNDIANVVECRPRSVTLSEDLMSQLGCMRLTPRQYNIAKEIVDNISDSGYLNCAVDVIANDISLKNMEDYSTDEVMEVLKIVQQLDPSGIAAMSLHECLSLQIHRLNLSTPTWNNAVKIIDYYFDLLGKKRFDLICAKLHIDEAAFQEAYNLIRRLNPKPGNSGDVAFEAIVPDFVVESDGDQLSVRLTKGNSPKLKLNEEYLKILEEQKKQSKLKMSDDLKAMMLKKNEAEDFMDAIEERNREMYKVMSKIVAVQSKFFLSGNEEDLVPLSQREIAQATGYDDSTISRFVKSKYVQTNFGTFLVQRCFSTAVKNDANEDLTAVAVKKLIATLVAEEDKSNPLNDNQIADMLKAKKINISRRTVTKYRQELKIPSSTSRRVSI